MPANQNLPVRVYTSKYSRLLSTVFGVKKAFAGAFAPIQTLDGITHKTKAFSVKTCNTPVVIGTYDTNANNTFGTGASGNNRFGKMTEVIYEDVDVNYSYTLAIHEGIDRHTVNNGLDAAVADRLKLQSEAQVRRMNASNGAYLASVAGKAETLSGYTKDGILGLFNMMATYYTNLEVDVPVTAYVVPDLFNAIIDLDLVTTAKGSSVNIEKNTINDFKGFKIVKEPTKYFVEGDLAYFSPDGVCIPFVGIETARTVESEDFDGVRLQAAAKGGQYCLDDNKPAIVKVSDAAAAGADLDDEDEGAAEE